MLPLCLLFACASKPAPEGYEAVEPDAEDLSAFDEDEPPPPEEEGVPAAPASGDSSTAPVADGEALAPEGEAAPDTPTEGEAAPDAKKK